MGYLTQSESDLWDAVVTGLEGEGFSFNPLTTSPAQYLAAALGQPSAYLTKSFAQMLAELNTSFGGSLSHLTSSVAHLLDDLTANIGAGGGGGDLPDLPDGFAFVVNGDSYVVDDNGDFVITEQ